MMRNTLLAAMAAVLVLWACGNMREPIPQPVSGCTGACSDAGETAPDAVIPVNGNVRAEVAEALLRTGYLGGPEVGDDDLFDALSAYIRTENFEEREQRRGYLDRMVLEYMKGQG